MNWKIECVRPIEQDAKQIMAWRNDPDTLKMSFHTEPKQWSSFYPEFLESYFTHPVLPPVFFTCNGERVAFIRFRDRGKDSAAELSIIVAPEWRQKGIGAECLSAIEGWASQRGVTEIYADVKPENLASIKLFEKASYEPVTKKGEYFTFVKRLEKRHKPSKVFIIAEAGSNWVVGSKEENWDAMRKLMDAAVTAGADAVKFQIFRAKDIYVKNAGHADYLAAGGMGDNVYDIFLNLEFPYEWIPLIAKECQERGIEWMSSAFSADDFKAIDPYVKRHKIASYEMEHVELLSLAAKSQKPVLISTGAADEDAISWTVDYFRQQGGNALTLLQCTACYPAPASAMNLRVIPWLKRRFNCEAGLSDHSLSAVETSVAAVALGATVLEKHFTVSHNWNGPDQKFALEPKNLKALVEAVRMTEEMLGTSEKFVLPCEEELYNFCKRRVQAIKEIQVGELLHLGKNIAILRPGKQTRGAHPKDLPFIEGKQTKRKLCEGEGVQITDV